MNRYYGGNPGLGFNHMGFNRFAAPRHMSTISNNTNSNDPKSRESRLFVGNLNPEGMTQDKLEEIFGRHGQIVGISVHKGYAFIQYATKEEARNACRLEQGRVINFQPMDINIVADPNPNRGKGFKRVQNPAYYNGSGYVDPATLPLIPAASQAGPPAAKKVRRFMEHTQMDAEGDEPSSWTCAYCKEESPTCWSLVKHVASTHQTRIYMEDSEKVSA
ncbi:heterogeneous nuclear ribonucleoprotein C-like isoform X1 [Acanthaster planci]|uniref:Heterogeneous nuclear ribonucleoprotein C-like isoform X1 n=1 Tax=Acanthaster planci TaxID=133434 RepID=A0A8B7YFC9_ACAPL|nr:heterogeneous nuclear ribonucleoprotein C-like isoform X1 [Acanthaster planci]XP_022091939.1 heterogeneous nuclear ribonucleoprotein C-like isoform X1 [Acanthaster planci]XP_022091940.1 heterogeneous nuclear ribonucleoprotein C-like isoform X1 [Acanthaster planci]